MDTIKYVGASVHANVDFVIGNTTWFYLQTAVQYLQMLDFL